MSAGLGFRVHIGWATWALVGDGEVAVGRIDVRDSGLRVTAPYHAAARLRCGVDDPRIVTAIGLLDETVDAVLGSELPAVPDHAVVLRTSDLAPGALRHHLARVHLGDANVYRDALAAALTRRGCAVRTVLESSVGLPPASPRPPGPWRAEEKLAVAAAELAAASTRS